MSLHPQDARPSSTAFGPVVRQLRTQQALSIGDLSHRSGLSSTTVTEMEDGELEPDLDQLFALSRGLGMEVSAIFRVWEDESTSAPAHVGELQAEVIRPASTSTGAVWPSGQTS